MCWRNGTTVPGWVAIPTEAVVCCVQVGSLRVRVRQVEPSRSKVLPAATTWRPATRAWVSAVVSVLIGAVIGVPVDW